MQRNSSFYRKTIALCSALIPFHLCAKHVGEMHALCCLCYAVRVVQCLSFYVFIFSYAFAYIYDAVACMLYMHVHNSKVLIYIMCELLMLKVRQSEPRAWLSGSCFFLLNFHIFIYMKKKKCITFSIVDD